jgi:hypothetical protein
MMKSENRLGDRSDPSQSPAETAGRVGGLMKRIGWTIGALVAVMMGTGVAGADEDWFLSPPIRTFRNLSRKDTPDSLGARLFISAGTESRRLLRGVYWFGDVFSYFMAPEGRLSLDACPGTPGQDSPLAAARRVIAALTVQDSSALDHLLAANERAESDDPGWYSRYPEGLDRTAHLDVLRNGHPRHDTRTAGAWGLGGWSVRGPAPIVLESDSNHAEDRVRCAVTLPSLVWEIGHPAGVAPPVGPSSLTLVMARGDVAQLLPGQPADISHWYIERWIEGRVDSKKIEALVLNGEDAQSLAADAPLAFAVKRISPLAAWPLELQFSLPVRDAVVFAIYDVAGRMTVRRELGGLEAGRTRVTIASPRLEPGVYWLRARQGAAESTLKMVVLR